MLYSNNVIYIQLIMAILYLFLEFRINVYKYIKGGILYVLYDEFMHLSFYVIVMFPFIYMIEYFLLGAAISVLIDIDHIVYSRSFNIKTLISQPRRPITHSLLYGILFAIFIYIIFNNTLLSVFVFIGLFLHIWRDMLDYNSVFLFPFIKKLKLNKFLYIIILFIFILFVNLFYKNIIY